MENRVESEDDRGALRRVIIKVRELLLLHLAGGGGGGWVGGAVERELCAYFEARSPPWIKDSSDRVRSFRWSRPSMQIPRELERQGILGGGTQLGNNRCQ